MEVSDVTKVRSFDAGEFEKVNLFETENFFADVYCFEEGQTQELHEHAGSDKVYHVLEGEAEITVGDESLSVGAGGTVLAGSGKPHGVVAEERARLLVFMAPHPAHADSGCDHGDETGHAEHEHDESGFDFGFVTVSSSRDKGEDESGDRAREIIEDEGHVFAEYRVVSDDADEIRDAVGTLVGEVDVVVVSGGTGLTDDDVTPETVRPVFDKEVLGFGEEFRRRSVDEVGTRGMLTRATAGVVDDTVVFVLPGSVGAVETGLSLALGEVRHMLGLVRR